MNEMIASLLAALTSAHETIGALRADALAKKSDLESHWFTKYNEKCNENEVLRAEADSDGFTSYAGHDAQYWHDQYENMQEVAACNQSDAYALHGKLDNVIATLSSFGLRVGDRPGPNWDCHNRSHITNEKDLEKSIRELLCFARDARKGNTIDAIKWVRVLTGLGLKESKDLVEEFLTLFPKS